MQISIHAAQEGCDMYKITLKENNKISIHAAQEGCDRSYLYLKNTLDISIHAAQEGCDQMLNFKNSSISYFNPRSPRGLRLLVCFLVFVHPKFQSTQPKRAATVQVNHGGDAFRDFNPRSPRGLRPLYPSYFSCFL